FGRFCRLLGLDFFCGLILSQPLERSLAHLPISRLSVYIDDGRVEIDTDVVEQPLYQPFCGLGGLSLQASTMAA
ncbi:MULTISPECIES: hypothetical protein, partial [Rhizobium/Agrobacterium group]|uniref:hypothetical protein n=1 Tax=Rhizobium/Agrobacterium group TaxID=227290 RepID=UPI003AB93C36